MSSFGRCEMCRGDRLRSTLVFDPEARATRCINRVVCEVDRRIRDARDKAREVADAVDVEHQGSARIVAEIESGERERKRLEREAKARERLAAIVAARAARPKKQPGPKPMGPGGRNLTNAERQRRKREKALRERTEQHRKERGT